MDDPARLAAADIPWFAPAPWPDARPVVEAALDHLPHVADDDTAAVVEHLVLAFVDLKAERDALRETMQAAHAVARECRIERDTIEARYHAALDDGRRLRAALRQCQTERAE